jgi:hypothetical protein
MKNNNVVVGATHHQRLAVIASLSSSLGEEEVCTPMRIYWHTQPRWRSGCVTQNKNHGDYDSRKKLELFSVSFSLLIVLRTSVTDAKLMFSRMHLPLHRVWTGKHRFLFNGRVIRGPQVNPTPNPVCAKVARAQIFLLTASCWSFR